MPSALHVRALTPDECLALLNERTHGHLAFTFHDRVDIEPVHYAYDAGWLYVRTAPGTKLTTITHHPWVAFEVDDVPELYRWRSVVARGTAYLTHPEDDEAGTSRYADAVTALRRVIPGAFTSDDPIPERSVILRIHVDEITGRSASPSSSASA